MIKLLVLVAIVATAVPANVAYARLSGEVRDDFITSLYHSCRTPKKPSEPSTELDQAKKSRLCNCAATWMADAIDLETVKLVELGQKSIDPRLLTEAVQWCKDHYADYSDMPPLSEVTKKKSRNGSALFDGKTHRFTAFRQHTYTKDFQLVKTVELENGKDLYDLSLRSDLSDAGLVEVRSRERYRLLPLAGSHPKLVASGYDFAFSMPNLSPYAVLLLDSKRNVLATQVFNKKDGLIYETHYVRSQALICTALEEARSRALKSAALDIFKEVLLVAIKSYAGTSYSGGTFTASTSSGQTVSGTYRTYDNSWLGEHYSRGLDAVFNGSASIADIDREMGRLDCGSL